MNRSLRIVEAESLGMCFGVREALRRLAEIEDPSQVTIWGELVHNESVLAGLAGRGFSMTGEDDRAVPPTPEVLITAHGVADRDRARLERAGRLVLDTTCPLVRRAHRAASSLAAEGRHVVVVGKPGHVEVRGLTGDLESFSVVAAPEDAGPIPHPRLGVVCQTTTPSRRAEAVLAALERANPRADIRFVDTICRPTKNRQAALERLLDRVGVVVVVGGRRSNNTRALVERIRARGVAGYRVEGPADLLPEWFAGHADVGLTAGTSTPRARIDAVRDALARIEPESVPRAS